jgi:WD40 repeat protein
MLKELLQSNISVKELTFKPGGDPVSFEVQVVNTSHKFASFQLELIPAGADDTAGNLWYSISPDISSKNPPGTTTNFQITIFDTPVPGFIGQMNLTVRIFSLELGDESRQMVRLILLKGTRAVPLKLKLPIEKFQVLPREEVAIPVRINNPGQITTETIVRLEGLNSDWFGGAIEQKLAVKPGKEVEVRFVCRIPFGVIDGLSSTAKGSLEILPMGNTDFRCDRLIRQLPARRLWWFRRTMSAIYPLILENASNLQQQVTLEVTCGKLPADAIDINPKTVDLEPQAVQPVSVTVTQRRPLMGKFKQYPLSAQAVWSDRRVDIQNENLNLELRIYPMVFLWWIIAGLTVTVPPILWSNSCLNPGNPTCGHQDAVTTVQFNGSGERAVSGSNDQTIRQWDIAGFTNPVINQEIGVIARLGKAVRMMRYKPTNNDQVAVGLENGEIQLWDLLQGKDKPEISFGTQRDDRVLDLRFTPDARSLFSAHGSGRVYRWNVDPNQSGVLEKPNNMLQLEFAIYSTAIVGGDGQNLVIGGKFNRLELWNWQKNQHYRLRYPKPGGQYDYVQALATSDFQPQMMASGDTQGMITLWDMNTCLADPKQPCKVLDQWNEAHGGQPVRSVALSRNGCYLVSGGGDGRVMLFPLTASGKRSEQHLAGIPVDKSFQPKDAIQSVDIRVTKGSLIILSGSEDTQIRSQTIPKLSQFGCERE